MPEALIVPPGPSPTPGVYPAISTNPPATTVAREIPASALWLETIELLVFQLLPEFPTPIAK